MLKTNVSNKGHTIVGSVLWKPVAYVWCVVGIVISLIPDLVKGNIIHVTNDINV